MDLRSRINSNGVAGVCHARSIVVGIYYVGGSKCGNVTVEVSWVEVVGGNPGANKLVVVLFLAGNVGTEFGQGVAVSGAGEGDTACGFPEQGGVGQV